LVEDKQEELINILRKLVAFPGPGELEEAHSLDESVQIQELLDYAKIMIGYITEFCSNVKPKSVPEQITSAISL
jgi:hypothetical protein